jgi:hypothetical protein
MKRLLYVMILALLSAPAYAINWGNLMYFHQGVASKPFAVTIADDGAGTAAASTLTSPVFATYRYTCSDTDGCGLTIGETNVVDGQYLTLYNVSANAITLTASAGVLQLSTATFAMAQYQQIHLQYQSDRWVEISRGGTSIGSASVDTTANYTWTGTHDFQGTFYGSGVNEFYNISTAATDRYSLRVLTRASAAITNAYGIFLYGYDDGADAANYEAIAIETPDNAWISGNLYGLHVRDLGSVTGPSVKRSIFVEGTAAIEFDPALNIDGGITLYKSVTNCSDSAGDAACSAAPAG